MGWLIAQSFSQIYRIDYIKIFALIIKCKLLNIFLAITILLKIIILKIDIINAYLESFLGQNNHSIYIKIC